MADNENAVTPTPENPIPDVDEIKPGIPTPAWPDEGGGGGGGTGGGVLVVGLDMQTMTLDKTWNEINSAPFAVVRFPESLYETTIGFIYTISKTSDTGECTIVVANGSNEGETTTWYNSVFRATTENDYPVMRNS